ncbi:protein kinase family protein [Nonomuraea soli]|uniref:Protein kinase domain-containing protein n=1 Tax=Nonomuraea soli TaxID=1032476 RepID=A0A7W0CHL1_9ACTN|nr:protein kinase family protein [Nonomuraea soli]MBA2891315.1 hypothetical protein [Nonomuraea soli]
MARGARLTAHGAVRAALGQYGDRALRELVDTAVPLGSGIGGQSALLQVAGTPVFVKRIPLTDLERRPEHVGSTANLFDLPAFCHYGLGVVGSPGFGAWRELAVHTMTTDWVLAGRYPGFPLMYHWRVLPGSIPVSEELADVERAVGYWGGGARVRHRLEALQESSASIALFLEYIPQNLFQWLDARIGAGADATDRACAMVERELAAGISFMNGHGLLHFDTHFENILTDGRRLYFADYGLAISSGFALSPQEAAFVERHQTYDRWYSSKYRVDWLVTALYGLERSDGEGRYRRVLAYAGGERPTGIPDVPAAIIARHAPIAAVMSDFFRAFQRQSRQVPYPA